MFRLLICSGYLREGLIFEGRLLFFLGVLVIVDVLLVCVLAGCVVAWAACYAGSLPPGPHFFV